MNFSKLKMLMEHFVDCGYAPGNTIKVYIGRECVFDYSCGYSNIDKKLKMSGDEYFNLYSCSKIATVTAGLQLVEKGIIMLNDPLWEYIPEYREMYIKTESGDLVRAKNDIKIINLFNMTAGLTYNLQSEGIKKAHALTAGKMDTDLVAKCIADDPLSFEPNEKFQYSLCHDVLAGLVSVVTGQKFRDYVKENIFEPLDMKNCTYHLTRDIEMNMATQYSFVTKDSDESFDLVSAQKNGNFQNGSFVDVGIGNSMILGEEYDSGGAGIISNVSDYAKLAQALANNGMGTTGERVLSPYSVELMKTNTLNDKQLKSFDWKQLKGYGYGLGVRTMIDKVSGGSIGNIHEFGWGGAAGASVYIDTKIGLAAVYAKHTLNPGEEYYQPRVRNVLYGCL